MAKPTVVGWQRASDYTSDNKTYVGVGEYIFQGTGKIAYNKAHKYYVKVNVELYLYLYSDTIENITRRIKNIEIEEWRLYVYRANMPEGGLDQWIEDTLEKMLIDKWNESNSDVGGGHVYDWDADQPPYSYTIISKSYIPPEKEEEEEEKEKVKKEPCKLLRGDVTYLESLITEIKHSRGTATAFAVEQRNMGLVEELLAKRNCTLDQVRSQLKNVLKGIKLTQYDVNEIKAALKANKTIEEIADKYNVQIGTINDINAGRTWRVEGEQYPIQKLEIEVSPDITKPKQKEVQKVLSGAKELGLGIGYIRDQLKPLGYAVVEAMKPKEKKLQERAEQQETRKLQLQQQRKEFIETHPDIKTSGWTGLMPSEYSGGTASEIEHLKEIDRNLANTRIAEAQIQDEQRELRLEQQIEAGKKTYKILSESETKARAGDICYNQYGRQGVWRMVGGRHVCVVPRKKK